MGKNINGGGDVFKPLIAFVISLCSTLAYNYNYNQNFKNIKVHRFKNCKIKYIN